MVLEELTGYPSASFNRICFDSKNEDGYSKVKGLGYNEIYKDQVAEMFSGWIDDNNAKYPAFATVNVSAIYDPEAGKLNVKVVGDGVEKFSDFMGEDAKLSVYLVEDGLISRQLNNGTWVTKFTHNCVLRKCVTSVTGDVINWTAILTRTTILSNGLQAGSMKTCVWWLSSAVRWILKVWRTSMLQMSRW